MGSKIFKTILKRKIDNFINTYGEDSNSLFKNAMGELIHPGEYGMYREECLKELLKFIVGKDMGISDGFIINANDEVSTQCDIVIYNSNISPLIDNNIAKFFPMETVNAIGEVKSNLSLSLFKEALRKIAYNKMLFRNRCELNLNRKLQFIEYDYPLSFLVCKKLNFNLNELEQNDIEEIYEGIPREFWHNIVLSLEDGTISYSCQFIKKLQTGEYRRRLKQKVKISSEIDWQYPIYSERNDKYHTKIKITKPKPDDVYSHIIAFLASLEQALRLGNKFEYEIVNYLDLAINNIFE